LRGGLLLCVTRSGVGADGDDRRLGPRRLHAQQRPQPASVNATLSVGIATGTLETSGGSGGLWHEFKGTVTCMVVEGAHATIGALGKDREVPTGGPPKAVAGEFAQLLTVEFGEYTDFTKEELPTYTDRFGDMLGTHDEGVEAASRPTAAKRARFPRATCRPSEACSTCPRRSPHPKTGA
jgi:hypothetical protein